MPEKYELELYSEEELDLLEAHITQYFGDFPTVLHEIASPDECTGGIKGAEVRTGRAGHLSAIGLENQ